MSTRLFENEASAGWVLTAALHSLAVGLVFWLVLALVRRQGPTEGCWFGRAGTVALLLLPLTLLTTGFLNRKSPPLPVAISRPSPAVAVDAVPSAMRLVLPAAMDLVAANPASAPRDYRSIAAHAFGGVWLLGALVLLLRMCHGAEKMRRLRKRLRAPHPDADSKLLALLERLGIAPARVRVAEADVVPFATGLVSPLIVVPANLCAVMKPHEARMILRHEQAHLRNGDLAWALAQGIARMLHWWNPFAHSVIRQTELASEGLCDRAALSGERGRNGKAYAHCLVDLAERTSRRRLPACALSVTGDFRRLKRRLLWIAEARPAPGAGTRATLKLLAPALVAASALGLTALNAGAELPAKKEAVATTRQDSGNAAVTKVGNVEIHAERTSYHGDEGRIRFEDVKIVTPFYECRAKTAEYHWDKDDPKDLDKASLRLEGGVWAQIGEDLALSESAEIHPEDFAIKFHGFPRITTDGRVYMASDEWSEYKYDHFGEGAPKATKVGSWTGQNVLPPGFRTEYSEVGASIKARETHRLTGVILAKGDVEIHYDRNGLAFEMTGGEAAYTAESGEILARKGVTLKLHGHALAGENAIVNLHSLTARVLGPGHFTRNGEKVIIDENAEVGIDNLGIAVLTPKATGVPQLSSALEAILRSSSQSRISEPNTKQPGVPNGAIIPDPALRIPKQGSGTPPPPEVSIGDQKKGIMIDADETSYENGVAVAKGNARCTYNHDGISLEITGGHLTYEANTGNVVMRDGAIVKLRGHEVFGEAATANIKLMIATVFGPGYFREDGRKISLEEGAGVRIDAEGVHPISAPKEPRELLVPDVHGNLRSISEFST